LRDLSHHRDHAPPIFLIVKREGVEFPSVIEKVGRAFFSQKEIFLKAEERTIEEFFFLFEEFENLKEQFGSRPLVS